MSVWFVKKWSDFVSEKKGSDFASEKKWSDFVSAKVERICIRKKAERTANQKKWSDFVKKIGDKGRNEVNKKWGDHGP
jgi:hypothetical protein